MMNELERIANLMIKNKLTLAIAESCTGGLICHNMTNIPGSSAFFEMGIISYSNTAKVQFLNVQKKTLEDHGAVSSQTAEEMAQKIRIKAGADIGLSTTGIAGPGGGTEEKPVGLVYIALSTKTDTTVYKSIFTGNRLENKESTCQKALGILIQYLQRQ
jgi:nicotinamide-nucleotide amidase